MDVKNRKKQAFKYIITDYVAALLSWSFLFLFRKLIISQPDVDIVEILHEVSFVKGIIIIPLFWLLFYYISGEYNAPFRRSRLHELGRTVFVTTLGVVLIFFILILDDTIISYKNYYQSFVFLWGIHFSLTYFPRLYLTTQMIHKLQKRIIGFNTIIVGGNNKALKVYEELEQNQKSFGNKIIGFVTIDNETSTLFTGQIPHLGTVENLINIINKENVEEVIIAIESSERENLQQILVKTKATDVVIKAIPDLLDILSGSVCIPSPLGFPIIELSHELMPSWQYNLKRVMDVLVSALALIILSPVFIILAIGVKISSKGPIFYTHKRMGRYGKPFTIYKFRSMIVDSENEGPALSRDNDPRITPFGRFMRKMRFDEFPQFYNVLVGDMSLVGPRPERHFFIKKIIEKAPHYLLLYKIRPGITSWGQVKFGYAENVDEMVERLKYDIIYIENMSIYVDLKIMIYTIKTVLEGSGK